jgi:nicotinamidase-related amidase
MPKQTLVVIDMQKCFSKYFYAIKGTLLAIKSAIKNNQPIILVRYIGCGHISHEIKDIIKNYNKVVIVNKNCCDGSEEVCQLPTGLACRLVRSLAGFCQQGRHMAL